MATARQGRKTSELHGHLVGGSHYAAHVTGIGDSTR